MKLVHLSDLHLGKRVNGFSMLEDQAYILLQIQGILTAEQPDLVVIAGDVYDKAVPGTEAVTLFDEFLAWLAKQGLRVCIISGNHDSPERIAFGGRLFEAAKVHLSPVYRGNVSPLCMEDAFGPIRIYLLPFLKPAHVRRFFPDTNCDTYTAALQTVIDAMGVDTTMRNILVTHQFVTGAARSDSEELCVGGTDSIDAAVFAAFDYTALGHLHSGQNVAEPPVRYCGAPLAYSFGEAAAEKSVTVVELREKGTVHIRTVPLTPRHALRTIKGTYLEVTAKAFYEHTDYQEAYVRIILTDEEDVPDAVGKLRAVYHNLMQLEYDNQRTRKNAIVGAAEHTAEKTPLELFSELYEKQNNKPMSEEQRAYLTTMIERVWEGEA